MTRLLRVSGALLLGALGGCAGIFQHHMPAVPASYAVQSPVAPAQLRVGSAERDITPEVGGYMAGFSIARTSTAISTPLKLRALVIDTPSRRIAIVGIDNLGVMRQDADWLKGGVAGFANGDVFLCASHTHAGPDLIGLWGYYGFSTGRDPAYLTKLHDALRQAVAEALASAVPAHFEFGQTRLPPAGLVKNSNRGGRRRVIGPHRRGVERGDGQESKGGESEGAHGRTSWAGGSAKLQGTSPARGAARPTERTAEVVRERARAGPWPRGTGRSPPSAR